MAVFNSLFMVGFPLGNKYFIIPIRLSFIALTMPNSRSTLKNAQKFQKKSLILKKVVKQYFA